VPSLSEECALMHPLQGASFLSTPLQGGILKPPALRVVGDFVRGCRAGSAVIGHNAVRETDQQSTTRRTSPMKQELSMVAIDLAKKVSLNF
jgi:hypothetical protein